MPGGVSIPTEIVSEIYCDLPRHAGKSIDMHHKCFNHLPFTTEACNAVYPFPQKLFQQFILTYQGMSAKVWACTCSVLVIYHSLLRHARRCIHTHQNYFGNLP